MGCHGNVGFREISGMCFRNLCAHFSENSSSKAKTMQKYRCQHSWKEHWRDGYLGFSIPCQNSYTPDSERSHVLCYISHVQDPAFHLLYEDNYTFSNSQESCHAGMVKKKVKISGTVDVQSLEKSVPVLLRIKGQKSLEICSASMLNNQQNKYSIVNGQI